MRWGNVEECCNIKNVTGGTATGGIAGMIEEKTEVKLCFNIGVIEGSEKVGGILGSSSKNSLTLENCYNKGNVTASKYVGGIVGLVRNPVKNCYNTGVISLKSTTNNSIGALFGEIETASVSKDKIENCYYLDTSTEKGCGNESSIGAIDGIKSKDKTKMETEVAGLLGKEYEENTEGDKFPKLKWE